MRDRPPGDVLGGLYYWDVTHTRIMRYDFAGTQTSLVFFAPGYYGTDACTVSAHAAALARRHGSCASLGSPIRRRAGARITDVSKVNVDAGTGTIAKSRATRRTRSQFAAFSPAGDQFVSVYGDTTSTDDPDGGIRDRLWFNDGADGDLNRSSSSAEADHPDWSPDG